MDTTKVYTWTLVLFLMCILLCVYTAIVQPGYLVQCALCTLCAFIGVYILWQIVHIR